MFDATPERDEDDDPVVLRAVASLRTLTPDQRLDVFYSFCVACGGDDPECNCWKDD